MNERAMLELAALAAGIGLLSDDSLAEYGGLLIDEPPYPVWNPLTDDGDAFRLMVACEMVITQVYAPAALPNVVRVFPRAGWPIVIEPHNDNPAAATRLAIVKAAAEIGRKMKEEGK